MATACEHPAPAETDGSELEGLQQGDRVWWGDYGDGVVLSANTFRLWILWEKAGRLDHLPSFARWLNRLPH